MKNKKIIAVLIAVSLLQLIFPLSLIACEKAFISDVLEKGEGYTLYYTDIHSMNRGVIHTNIESRYTVGYRWWGEDEDVRHGDTVDCYFKLCIEKADDGNTDFFVFDEKKKELTDYNWLYTYDAFNVRLDDYEFVRSDFGMKEFVEAALLICDESNEVKTYEEFTDKRDGVYNTIWDVPFEGKVTLRVYKGIGLISEFYIGDDLVMQHKAAK